MAAIVNGDRLRSNRILHLEVIFVHLSLTLLTLPNLLCNCYFRLTCITHHIFSKLSSISLPDLIFENIGEKSKLGFYLNFAFGEGWWESHFNQWTLDNQCHLSCNSSSTRTSIGKMHAAPIQVGKRETLIHIARCKH